VAILLVITMKAQAESNMSRELVVAWAKFSGHQKVVIGYLRESGKRPNPAPPPLNVQDSILALVGYGSQIVECGDGDNLKLSEKQKALLREHYYDKRCKYGGEIPFWVQAKKTRSESGKTRKG
jgi:hypothetical protein